MSNKFDPIKALKEEIAGLTDVRAALVKRERNLQAQFGELEVELNALVAIARFRRCRDCAQAGSAPSIAG